KDRCDHDPLVGSKMSFAGAPIVLPPDIAGRVRGGGGEVAPGFSKFDRIRRGFASASSAWALLANPIAETARRRAAAVTDWTAGAILTAFSVSSGSPGPN